MLIMPGCCVRNYFETIARFGDMLIILKTESSNIYTNILLWLPKQKNSKLTNKTRLRLEIG